MTTKIPKPVHTDNVLAKPSNIPNGGTGLFAKVDIPRGSRICTYAGRLYDSSEAIYRDPTYMVNFELGKGFKLDGDGVDGDIGHYANASQIDDDGVANPPMNGGFCMKSKKQWVVVDEASNDTFFRGRFDLIARKHIAAGDEIILDYGKGYWRTMHAYWEKGPPPRSAVSVAREERAKRRLLRLSVNVRKDKSDSSSPQSKSHSTSPSRSQSRKRILDEESSVTPKKQKTTASPRLKSTTKPTPAPKTTNINKNSTPNKAKLSSKVKAQKKQKVSKNKEVANPVLEKETRGRKKESFEDASELWKQRRNSTTPNTNAKQQSYPPPGKKQLPADETKDEPVKKCRNNNSSSPSEDVKVPQVVTKTRIQSNTVPSTKPRISDSVVVGRRSTRLSASA